MCRLVKSNREEEEEINKSQIKSRILIVTYFLTPMHVFLSGIFKTTRKKNEELLVVQDVVFHLQKSVSSFYLFLGI